MTVSEPEQRSYDVIREAMEIADAVERHEALRLLIEDTLISAVYAETGLDADPVEGLLFPLSERRQPDGAPWIFFTVDIAGEAWDDTEWAGQFVINLFDDTYDAEASWLPLGSGIPVVYPLPEAADDHDPEEAPDDDELDRLYDGMQDAVNRFAKWLLEVLTTEEWVTSRFDLLATWTPEARAEHVQQQRDSRESAGGHE